MATKTKKAKLDSAENIHQTFNVKCTCSDLGPRGEISTGIGFLDHMIDQLNSHAQIGVNITVESFAGHNNLSEKNRFSRVNQQLLLETIGKSLGQNLEQLIPKTTMIESRFCCPLDEALAEANIAVGTESYGLKQFALEPIGKYPGEGRKNVGSLEIKYLSCFFKAMANAMKCQLSLRKMRGQNAHHIIESTFKAFSRALRCLLDNIKGYSIENSPCDSSLSPRKGQIDRKTKETEIIVKVVLDSTKNYESFVIDTGVPLLNLIYKELQASSGIFMSIVCKGDLWIDDHHTAEDVSIAVGKALDGALGNKGGLNRMWTATGKCDSAEVEAVADISNRPMLTSNVNFCPANSAELIEGLSVEMIDHVFESLVLNSRITVHFLQLSEGSTKELAIATARALGSALKRCISVDPRRAGRVSSSKGTLSA